MLTARTDQSIAEQHPHAKYAMHKSARDFALTYRLNLGRHANGHYYIGGPYAGLWLSMYPTAASAIRMMRKFMTWRDARTEGE